jgi:hypothetical protein
VRWETRIAEAASESFRKNNPPPEISSPIRFFVQSFFTLSSERSIGQGGMSLIPYSKIIEYGEWIGYKDITQFMKIIQQVDQSYVSDFYKKMEQNRK